MDPGNVNPTEHLHWLLRETAKKKNKQSDWREPGFELGTLLIRVQCYKFRSALCSFHSENFITDGTSRSAGAGVRVSFFNRSNDATVRTLEVPLVHASCIIIIRGSVPNVEYQFIFVRYLLHIWLLRNDLIVLYKNSSWEKSALHKGLTSVNIRTLLTVLNYRT